MDDVCVQCVVRGLYGCEEMYWFGSDKQWLTHVNISGKTAHASSDAIKR